MTGMTGTGGPVRVVLPGSVTVHKRNWVPGPPVPVRTVHFVHPIDAVNRPSTRGYSTFVYRVPGTRQLLFLFLSYQARFWYPQTGYGAGFKVL